MHLVPCAFLALFSATVFNASNEVVNHFAASNVSVSLRIALRTSAVNLVSFSIDSCRDEGLCFLAIRILNHLFPSDTALLVTSLKASSVNVLSISQVKTRFRPNTMPSTQSQSPLPADAIHGPTGVAKSRSLLNATGKGIRVALIDSGVHYLHPSLGGCFGPGCRVSFGHDLVGDAFTGAVGSSTMPDSDPLDNCSVESHGTHVAGIVGGVSGIGSSVQWTGVAIEADIGMYRV
ncbi:hypothetical protein HDU99_007780, partial [Rhizoclosmatium hyalinum]